MPNKKPRLSLPVSITLKMARKVSPETSTSSSISESERSNSPPAWWRRSDVGTQRLRSSGVRSALPTQLRPANVSRPSRIALPSMCAAISITGAARDGLLPMSHTRVDAKTGACLVGRRVFVGSLSEIVAWVSVLVLSVGLSASLALVLSVPLSASASPLTAAVLVGFSRSRRRRSSRLAFLADAERACESLEAWLNSEGQSAEKWPSSLQL